MDKKQEKIEVELLEMERTMSCSNGCQRANGSPTGE